MKLHFMIEDTNAQIVNVFEFDDLIIYTYPY